MTDPKDWENYLESRYNAKFDKLGVRLVANAAIHSVNQGGGAPVNTRDFLPIILSGTKTLSSFTLGSSISVTVGGTEPWREGICNRDREEPPREPFPAFSQNVEDSLVMAVALAKQTGEYSSVNEWHIAAEILMSEAPGIEHSLTEGSTSSVEAVRVLLGNLKEMDPGLSNANGQAFQKRLLGFLEMVEEQSRDPIVEPIGRGTSKDEKGGKSFGEVFPEMVKKTGLSEIIRGDPDSDRSSDDAANEKKRDAQVAVENLEKEVSRPLSPVLRDILVRSFDGFSSGQEISDGITTARIFLMMVFYGKHRRDRAPLLGELFDLVGDSKALSLESRFKKVAPREEPEYYEIESGSSFYSDDVVSLLTIADSIVGQLHSKISENALLQAIVGDPPKGCEWVVENEKEIWSEISVRLYEQSDPLNLVYGPGSTREEALETSTMVVPLAGVEVGKDGGTEYREEPSGKSFSDLRDEFPMDESLVLCLNWTETFSIEQGERGAITAEGLFYLLLAWTGFQQPLGDFYQSISNENEPRAGVAAIGKTVPYEHPTKGGIYPTVTSEVLAVFSRAQKIATNFGSQQITPEYLMGAILFHSYPNGSWGEFLNEPFGQPISEIQGEFLKFIDKKFGGDALQEWKEILQNSDPGPPSSKANETAKKEEETRTAPDNDSSRGVGTFSQDPRDATSDELGIGIDELSDSIQTLFETTPADTDLIFALYGPWGRGKTTLMNEVRRKLDERAVDEYAFVDFSAWKYPTRPEVWVYLYETIAAQAAMVDSKEDLAKTSQRDRFQKLRIGFRCGILKTGWLPLYLVVVGMASFLIPFLDAFGWFKGILGVSGIAALLTFLGKATTMGRSFAQRYLALPDHSSKLGMQAVIGKDLDDLLRVWIDPKQKELDPTGKAREAGSLGQFWGLPFVLVAAFGLTYVPPLPQEGAKNPAPEFISYKSVSEFPLGKRLTPETAEKLAKDKRIVEVSQILQVEPESGASGKPKGWLKSLLTKERITLLGFLLICIGFGWVVSISPQRRDMLLLVIDDLDRCRPDQMLSVIESLRLFLDNPGMQSRLQIAMLVDNRLLGHALLRRAEEDGILKGSEEPEGNEEPACERKKLSELGAKYIQEQREKLFLAELALSKLNQSDLDGIAKKYLPENPIGPAADPNLVSSEEDKGSSNEIGEGKSTDNDALSTDKTEEGNPVSNNALSSENVDDEKQSIPSGWETAVDRDRESEDDASTTTEEVSRTGENADGGGAETEGSDRVYSRSEDRFHPDEIAPLREAIKQLEPHKPTPRQIRTFLARYQLARLILENQGIELEVDELIEGITAEMGLRKVGTGETKENEGSIRQIARLVVCPPAIYDEHT